MNEIYFRKWMKKNKKTIKVQSDIISRLKKIEKEIENCDLDEEYYSDHCKHLLSFFDNMGKNSIMKELGNVNLPIGKYYMATYKYAINVYIKFMDDYLISNM